MVLNWIDYIILGIVLFSVLISLVRGFVREAVSLVIWGTAVVVSLRFAAAASQLMPASFGTPMLRLVIAGVLIFVVILVIGILVNALVASLVSGTGMSGLDRMIGVVFGAIRGILIVSMVLVFVQAGNFRNNPSIKKSVFIHELQPLVSWLHKFVPDKASQWGNWFKVDVKKVKHR